jgi:hypothetical protein
VIFKLPDTECEKHPPLKVATEGQAFQRLRVLKATFSIGSVTFIRRRLMMFQPQPLRLFFPSSQATVFELILRWRTHPI